MIKSRASLTQSGQRESVVRGQPRVGLDFSQDFNSGFSDHRGVKEGFGRYLLKYCIESKATLAVWQSAQSNDFQSWLPTVFGIILHLSFFNSRLRSPPREPDPAG